MNISEIYGSMVFNDAVMRQRLPSDVYKSLKNTIAIGKPIDVSIANVVANAMKDWAVEKGATHYTHWFQPLTSVTAEKHDSFISPVAGDKVVMDFSGKELIRGESDASSFPSGGLRETCNARGYTAWDPSSYAFIKDGTLYIPTVFCSYTGVALDTKTPLLRSVDILSEQALRVLRAFGDTESKRVSASVGAEQEYFLISKEKYDLRPDIKSTGRTLFGMPAPKGQELEDHYYGPIKSRVAKFMSELDCELWKLGISSKTKHNEVAPSQHELAPIYENTNVAVDHNLLTMDMMRRVAENNGMVCLLHEKPYEGLNGSGKHNNWSMSTDTGKNLFSPGHNPAQNTQFLLFLSAVISAVDDYQDLLRISVASAGNDHRLGADEAPPAIVSVFLGEELEEIVDSIIGDSPYTEKAANTMDLGVAALPTFRYDSTDRNRTSPFAFTGNKFEFRMLGSAQNIALPNIVLNTSVAKVLCDYADRLSRSYDVEMEAKKIVKESFTSHRRIIFNGNGYSKEWPIEAKKRGLLDLKSCVDAYPHFTDEKNISLFTGFGVMSENEIYARKEIMFETYHKTVDIEARSMTDIAQKQIFPAVEAYIYKLSKTVRYKTEAIGEEYADTEREVIRELSHLNREIYSISRRINEERDNIADMLNAEEIAIAYNKRVIPLMAELRCAADKAEGIMPCDLWPLPSYAELTYWY